MIFSLAMVKDLIENQGYYISNHQTSFNSPITMKFILVGKNGPPISLDTDDPEIIEYVATNIK